jgi:TonB-dependent SusC/RagA subfamily outer membrane receptor
MKIYKMRIKVILFTLLSFLYVAVSSGQKHNKKVFITGIVTDTRQIPLAGAMIRIDGKRTNAITNSYGTYKLKVRSDADSISIFAGGDVISTIPIMGRTKIDFILNEADLFKHNAQINDANDKQINVGFGTVNQKNLLTPVSTIDGRGGKYAAYKDIFEILKGTAGVIVRGTSVQIEGPSSMFSSTEPLYVVDGMTVRTLDGITPAMVESISVLKGSSTTIYGSRGGNGVILITLIK